VPEPRTHYQLSFTARQATVFFVVCLLALGLSFFFGLMAGLSDRAAPPSRAASVAKPSPSAESEGSVELPSGRRDREVAARPPAAEPTAPETLQAFEDAGMEPTPAVAAPERGTAPTPLAAPGIWVQVASLTSRREADALASRLGRRGYRAQVAVVTGGTSRLFRVRIGPYGNEEEARRMAERLRRQERIPQIWIVREDR
jgi:DedD protein